MSSQPDLLQISFAHVLNFERPFHSRLRSPRPQQSSACVGQKVHEIIFQRLAVEWQWGGIVRQNWKYQKHILLDLFDRIIYNCNGKVPKFLSCLIYRPLIIGPRLIIGHLVESSSRHCVSRCGYHCFKISRLWYSVTPQIHSTNLKSVVRNLLPLHAATFHSYIYICIYIYMRQLLLPNFLKELAVATLILRILTSTNDPIRVRVSVISSTTAVFKPSSLQCGGFFGPKKKCKESDVQGDGRVPNQICRSVTKGTTDLASLLILHFESPYHDPLPLAPVNLGAHSCHQPEHD